MTESVSSAGKASVDLQVDADGRLRHLLTLDGLPAELLTRLLDRAEHFLAPPGQPAVRGDSLDGKTIANLFFENSTRTRSSFELAALRLGADVLNLDVNTSSTTKGESILDTVYTLQAMQVDGFVVRDRQPGTQAMIAAHVEPNVSVVNAGEANVSHPTQGLLDLLTIRRHKGEFSALTVVIVGDVAHSRVARSAAAGLRTLGVGELRLVCPPGLAPEELPGTRVMNDLDEGLRGADVVMALRIQKERFADQAGIPDARTYAKNYGINRNRLAVARDDVIVMHPGPMNRDVEISSTVADGPSSVITEQVTNGVAVRMAVLEHLLSRERDA